MTSFLLAGLLWPAVVSAQTAPALQAPRPPALQSAAPLTLSQQETLGQLYSRLRPATLRLEQCAAARCSEPDGIGTGFLIAPDGTALTAYHVVFQSAKLWAVSSDGQKHAVKVVGYDDQHDLAVIKVDLQGKKPFLPLARRVPQVGDAVLSIGNGGGVFLKPKTGRLLALNADAQRADFPPGTLEISAPLIPGDSGGPVLNAVGEVVGVVSFISVRGASDPDRPPVITAYAVPLSQNSALLGQLRRGLKRDAPVIGVGLSGPWTQLADLPEKLFGQMSKDLHLQFRVPGAFFTYVAPGSPAARAGIVPLKFGRKGEQSAGDLVTAVNGKRVNNFSEFQYAVRAYSPGDTVRLTVLRQGKTLTVPLKLVGRASVAN